MGSSSAYTRPCKHCGRKIQLRNMPAGQWVAFEGEYPHKCLPASSNKNASPTNPNNKTSPIKDKPNDYSKSPISSVYKDLDFLEIKISNQESSTVYNSNSTEPVSSTKEIHSNTVSKNNLEAQILNLLKNSPMPIRAREIAKELSKNGHIVDRTIVNQHLYGSLKDKVQQDDDYCWSIISTSTKTNTPKDQSLNNQEKILNSNYSSLVNKSNVTNQQEREDFVRNTQEKPFSELENKQNTPPKVIDKYSREVIHNKPSNINDLEINSLYSEPIIKEVYQPKPIVKEFDQSKLVIKEVNQPIIKNSKVDLS